MDKLGIENVIESDEEWPTVGWESIAKSDPTVIVIAEVDRRRFPADDVEKKLAFLKTDPVAKEMTAVREGRIIVMDAHAMSATIRSIFGLETVARALSEFDLGQCARPRSSAPGPAGGVGGGPGSGAPRSEGRRVGRGGAVRGEL